MQATQKNSSNPILTNTHPKLSEAHQERLAKVLELEFKIKVEVIHVEETHQEIFNILKELVSENCTAAMYPLAMYYLRLDGKGHESIPRDIKQATALLKSTTEAHPDNGQAWCSLGKIYLRKHATKEDARQCFKRAYELSNVEATFQLGLMLAGEGKDLKSALTYLTQATAAGHIPAKFQLGLVLENEGKDLELALNYFIQAGAENHRESLYHAGIMYEQGRGTEKNLKLAHEYYYKAALHGTPEAMFKVAEKLLKDSDHDLAIYWYRLAVNANHTPSTLKLAAISVQTAGAINDVKKAEPHLKKAEAYLLKCVRFNLDIYKKLEKASDEKEPYSKDKLANAAFNLGVFYARGDDGTFKTENTHLQGSLAKAIFYFGQAAKSGHKVADSSIGKIYLALASPPTNNAPKVKQESNPKTVRNNANYKVSNSKEPDSIIVAFDTPEVEEKSNLQTTQKDWYNKVPNLEEAKILAFSRSTVRPGNFANEIPTSTIQKFENLTAAAEYGSQEARNEIGNMYREGKLGVRFENGYQLEKLKVRLNSTEEKLTEKETAIHQDLTKKMDALVAIHTDMMKNPSYEKNNQLKTFKSNLKKLDSELTVFESTLKNTGPEFQDKGNSSRQDSSDFHDEL